MVEVTFIVPVDPIDAHVSFEAGTTVPFNAPFATPAVPLHAFNGNFNVILLVVGTLLSPGETVARACGIVQLSPLSALAGAVCSAPNERMSAMSHAKAAHHSHYLPP
jgi:hypothetical protein